MTKYLEPSFSVAVGGSDNWDRIFGERQKNHGKRWVYTQNGRPLPEPIEVTQDYEPPADATVPLVTDRYLEGERTPDGVDISSRRKRDEYMRREGVTHANDYRQQLAKAKEKRAEFFRGNTGQTDEIAETVGRKAYQLQTQRKKR